jgi:hypothetical protein
VSVTIPEELKLSDIPRAQRPRCGAKTKAGKPCQAQALTTGYCAIHSGIVPGGHHEAAPPKNGVGVREKAHPRTHAQSPAREDAENGIPPTETPSRAHTRIREPEPPTKRAKPSTHPKIGTGPAGSYLYSEALGDEICSRLANGDSLRAICQTEGMPGKATVLGWTLDASHPFAQRYVTARQTGYLTMAEELLEISDNSKADFIQGEDGRRVADHEHIARARLRVDTRKWMLSKMLPRVFGDKVTTEVTGPGGGPVQVRAQVDEFMKKIDAIGRRQKELAAMQADEAEEIKQ